MRLLDAKLCAIPSGPFARPGAAGKPEDWQGLD